MNKLLNPILLALVLAVPALVAAPDAAAIDPADVRDFEDVFVISGSAPGRDRVEVRWPNTQCVGVDFCLPKL